MMYSKPRGKELAALKRIHRLVNDIEAVQSELSAAADEILNDPSHDDHVSINTWSITSGHALDGVRVNGTGRMNSIANFALGVRRIRERRDGTQRKIDKALRKADRLLETLERIVSPFSVCAACNGYKGKNIAEGHYKMLRWYDCHACNGRGIT